MTFGERLKQLRREAGVTQRRLAETTNLDFSYISKLENDRNPPPAADTIVRICEALNIPAERLLALKGTISTTPAARNVTPGPNPKKRSFASLSSGKTDTNGPAQSFTLLSPTTSASRKTAPSNLLRT